MKPNWVTIAFMLGFILGALAHDADVTREYNKTGKIKPLFFEVTR